METAIHWSDEFGVWLDKQKLDDATRDKMLTIIIETGLEMYGQKEPNILENLKKENHPDAVMRSIRRQSMMVCPIHDIETTVKISLHFTWLHETEEPAVRLCLSEDSCDSQLRGHHELN